MTAKRILPLLNCLLWSALLYAGYKRYSGFLHPEYTSYSWKPFLQMFVLVPSVMIVLSLCLLIAASRLQTSLTVTVSLMQIVALFHSWHIFPAVFKMCGVAP